VKIAKLDKTTALDNVEILTEMYYQNAVRCSSVFSFSYGDAEKKIYEMIEYIAANKAICYGLFDGNLLVGYIWAYYNRFRDENRVYISEIRVIEEYRGKGYGEKLINCVEKEAKGLNVNAMYIHAEAMNEGAIRLYKRIGFEPERIQLRKEIHRDIK